MSGPPSRREVGILFTGPNVCAIRERRKTQTRRLKINYGVGDRLWIRETWAVEELPLPGELRVVYAADRGARYVNSRMPRYAPIGPPFYLASSYAPTKWRPSIFMPRWACRVVLEVTALRREPLGAVTEADAVAEGTRSVPEYRALWRSIHGAWHPSQLVYVVDFRVVEDWPIL